MNNKRLLLAVLGAGKSKIMGACLGRALLLLEGHLLIVTSHAGRGEGALWCLPP